MEDPTNELEDFVHKINQISKSRLMGICVIPGLAIEKPGDVYLRMASSYDKTDEDHGIKKGLWEDSGFDCWFDGEDDDSVNDVSFGVDGRITVVMPVHFDPGRPGS